MKFRTCRHGAHRAVKWTPFVPTLLIVMALSWAHTGPASAQTQPRIGLSASQDTYVGEITVEPNTDFTLYAMIFGADDTTPLAQSISEIPWVIHQVCCGAVLTITGAQFNPALESVGNPLAGTVSTLPECTDRDSIWLATLTVQMESTQAGSYEWASGPFGSILDCNAESVFMRGLAVTVTMEGSPVPNETTSWGQIKATYR